MAHAVKHLFRQLLTVAFLVLRSDFWHYLSRFSWVIYFLLGFLSSLCIPASNPLSSEELAQVCSPSAGRVFSLLSASCAAGDDVILFFEFCFVSSALGMLSTESLLITMR